MPAITEETNLLQTKEIKPVEDLSKMSDREFQMMLSQQQVAASNKTTFAIWTTWGLSMAIGIIGGIAYFKNN
jgi:hypothetical protein